MADFHYGIIFFLLGFVVFFIGGATGGMWVWLTSGALIAFGMLLFGWNNFKNALTLRK